MSRLTHYLELEVMFYLHCPAHKIMEVMVREFYTKHRCPVYLDPLGEPFVHKASVTMTLSRDGAYRNNALDKALQVFEQLKQLDAKAQLHWKIEALVFPALQHGPFGGRDHNLLDLPKALREYVQTGDPAGLPDWVFVEPTAEIP